MKHRSKNSKSFTQMSAEEMGEATKRFDRRELADDAGVAMTRKEHDEWVNEKPKRGRPRTGLGAVNVLISFERGLLDRADAFARGRGIGRSALIAEALESLIGKPSLRRRTAI